MPLLFRAVSPSAGYFSRAAFGTSISMASPTPMQSKFSTSVSFAACLCAFASPDAPSSPFSSLSNSTNAISSGFSAANDSISASTPHTPDVLSLTLCGFGTPASSRYIIRQYSPISVASVQKMLPVSFFTIPVGMKMSTTITSAISA